ncbi:ATPase P [Oscillibacter sp.]|uniref:HAD family hydrolase n=1 Tax=Oscillibacter sp. TaxID=1945593 RepID=UPI00289CC769|nr:ATPase P [Oscillibacter sp.]
MLNIDIPGRAPVEIDHVVLDYNGTIAVDGALLPGVAERIEKLREFVSVTVLTADTYGTVRAQCEPLGIAVQTFSQAGAALCKESIVRGMDGGILCIGNGFNDIQMFDAAALRVAVLEREGLCPALLSHADVLVSSPLDALDLLLKPNRLRATLRS